MILVTFWRSVNAFERGVEKEIWVIFTILVALYESNALSCYGPSCCADLRHIEHIDMWLHMFLSFQFAMKNQG